MPDRSKKILHVALAVPVRRCFDYLIVDDPGIHSLIPGTRVIVPFGKTAKRTGIVLGTSNKSDLPKTKLKTIIKVLDDAPLYSMSHHKLLLWASQYYHHPIGEVVLNTLPIRLKQGKAAHIKKSYGWRLSVAGWDIDEKTFKKASLKSELLRLLKQTPAGLSTIELPSKKWGNALKGMEKKELIERFEWTEKAQSKTNINSGNQLNDEQKTAAVAIKQKLGKYQTFLLNGVTGSGKTEVYIDIIRHVIVSGQQALVLVPEIGLTPQLINRFKAQIDTRLVVLHSGLTDHERLKAWLQARNGLVSLVLGTRSAIWTPLNDPGVIIIDEEHDMSYKQQDGFRYSARDVAIMRGNMCGIPVILGSATPSMESLLNARNGKYSELRIMNRAAKAAPPRNYIIDLRNKQMTGAFSKPLLTAIGEELKKKHQVLLFLNKRGYSPVLMCHDCGWIGKCQRCDIQLTYHKSDNRLACHHCGSQKPVPRTCPDCSGEKILQIGHGTERLSETLTEIFPQARILRIDRDTTRKKGAMERMLETIHKHEVDILIGTQMLAKGHDFPTLNLVGIIDADRGLYSADYRASEQMAQLITQVSGRAGRSSDMGRVIIQTHYPDHPLLLSLISSGYDRFSNELLNERRQTGLPPFSYQALLRSEDVQQETNIRFLNEARGLLTGKHNDIEIYGPVTAPMEKRAGRRRYQLLVQCDNRNRLKQVLEPWSRALETLASAKRVRWSLDVDPMDMI